MAADPDERATRMLLALPRAPGDAPFRIEGVAYRGHLERCERVLPGGNAAAIDAVRAGGEPGASERSAHLDGLFTEVVIGLAGGRDARRTSAGPIPEASAHGVEVVSLPMEVRWATA